MDFTFTEEQKHLRKSVREFAEGEIGPHVMEWDEASHFPTEMLPKLAEMGLMGVIFPEQYGGAGLGYIEYATAIEELSRVDGSVGLFVAAHNSLCSNHIYKFGSEEQKKKYLVPLAQGKKLGAWSLTEPEAGSDAGGRGRRRCGGRRLGTERFEDVYDERALCGRLRGDGGDGQGQGVARDQRVYFGKGHGGIQAGEKGKQAGDASQRHRGSDFHGLQIGAKQLLGPQGEGFMGSLQILDGGRISIAALALGMAQGALEAATKYAKQRKQFGKTIAEFQAIQFKLADMATEVEAARLLVYQAAWLADQKERAVYEGIEHGEAVRERGGGARGERVRAGARRDMDSSRTIRRRSFIGM